MGWHDASDTKGALQRAGPTTLQAKRFGINPSLLTVSTRNTPKEGEGGADSFRCVACSGGLSARCPGAFSPGSVSLSKGDES